MRLKTRLDQAEAEMRERVRARWHAAGEAIWAWIRANATSEENDAYCRVFFAPVFKDLLARQAAGEHLTKGESDALGLHSILGELRLHDQTTVEALEARIPPALMGRLKAAAEAARAAGI